MKNKSKKTKIEDLNIQFQEIMKALVSVKKIKKKKNAKKTKMIARKLV